MLIPAIIDFMTNLQDNDEAVSYIPVGEGKISSTVLLPPPSPPPPPPPQRKWCLHTLFYILCDNEENKKQALENPHFGVSARVYSVHARQMPDITAETIRNKHMCNEAGICLSQPDAVARAEKPTTAQLGLGCPTVA